MLLLGLQSHVGDVAAIKRSHCFLYGFCGAILMMLVVLDPMVILVRRATSSSSPMNDFLMEEVGWMVMVSLFFLNARTVFVVCLRTVVVKGEPLRNPINAIPPHRNVLRSLSPLP